MIEVLFALAIALISFLAFEFLFIWSGAQVNDLKHHSEADDLTTFVISDFLKSPLSKITAECTAAGVWTLKTTSTCTTNDYRTESAVYPLSAASKTLPATSVLLGKNYSLSTDMTAMQTSPTCVDLMQCQYLISNNLLELTFQYWYMSAKLKGLDSRIIKVRRSPW